MPGSDDLKKQIEELDADIRSDNQSMSMMRINRAAFVDDITLSVDGIDGALATMREKLMMKINSIKAIINKFDLENDIPNPDDLD